MDLWADEVVPELFLRASTDPFYQELFSRYMAAEQNYRRILHKLDSEAQMQLDDYIALCEDLQFQLARLAFEFGRNFPGNKETGH